MSAAAVERWVVHALQLPQVNPWRFPAYNQKRKTEAPLRDLIVSSQGLAAESGLTVDCGLFLTRL
jgi:hypothetical protein